MIATVGDHTVAWDDAGTGRALLFVHGFPHDRTLWAHQRRALSSLARCIVPDLRGFGESAGATFGPAHVARSVDAFADDLVALLDHLEIDRATVCGLSMGGYIAMAMWRRHADRFEGLILCDTRAGADSDETRAARGAMIDKARTEGAAAVAAAQLDKMVGASTKVARRDVVETMTAMMARQRPDALVGALEAMRDRPDSRETLRSITVPTLVIVGDEDVITPPAEAEAMRALFPATTMATLETIPGAGHVSCIERPSAVTHAISDYLHR